MLFFILLSIGISLIYFILILSFYIGWNKIEVFQKGNYSSSELFISLIVPYRNEESNIPSLINSILNQTLNNNQFEVILINDNSSDKSFLIANQHINGNKLFKLLSLSDKRGKKEALLMGIRSAQGNLIVTTDADCTHHPEWLETIYTFYLQTRPKMILGPVFMKGQSFFENFQSLDFFSLIASGAGASGLNKPIMCNGANLAFETTIFSDIDDPLKKSIQSGDDIFLLHNTKKIYPGGIRFLKSEKAVVTTNSEVNFNSYLKQRKRWASKSKAYTDKDTILTAFIVLLMNVSIIVGFILWIWFSYFIWILLFQIIIKLSIDFILLHYCSLFFNKRVVTKYFVVAELFNLILIPYIAISSWIGKISWKESSSVI
jgi:glycosyltransferase involved in cell wall biosynthesis